MRDSDHTSCNRNIQMWKSEVQRLSSLLKERDHIEVGSIHHRMIREDIPSPKASLNTDVKTSYERKVVNEINSRSEVESYGNNYKEYINVGD